MNQMPGQIHTPISWCAGDSAFLKALRIRVDDIDSIIGTPTDTPAPAVERGTFPDYRADERIHRAHDDLIEAIRREDDAYGAQYHPPPNRHAFEKAPLRARSQARTAAELARVQRQNCKCGHHTPHPCCYL